MIPIPNVYTAEYYFAEVCPYGTREVYDNDNKGPFSTDTSNQDDDEKVLGDDPVTLPTGTNITVTPSPSTKPNFTVMEVEITVENVTSVTFVFVDETGNVVATVTVSTSSFLVVNEKFVFPC